jgi:hypothetical protein
MYRKLLVALLVHTCAATGIPVPLGAFVYPLQNVQFDLVNRPAGRFLMFPRASGWENKAGGR